MDLLTGAAIGAKLLGGTLANRTASKNRKHQAQLDHDNWKHARDQFEQGIQYRVKDAKKAGLHPLFAMGYSPTSTSGVHAGGGMPQGSALGAAVADAGAMAAASQPRGAGPLQELQKELLRSQIRGQDAMTTGQNLTNEKMAIASRNAVISQRTASGGNYHPATGVTTYGMDSARPGSMDPRALRRAPDEDFPGTVTYAGMDNPQRMPNPELGMDEVNQGVYVWNWLGEHGLRMGNSIKARIRRAARVRKHGRQTAKNRRRYLYETTPYDSSHY